MARSNIFCKCNQQIKEQGANLNNKQLIINKSYKRIIIHFISCLLYSVVVSQLILYLVPLNHLHYHSYNFYFTPQSTPFYSINSNPPLKTNLMNFRITPYSKHKGLSITLTLIVVVLIHYTTCNSITPTTRINDLPYFGSHYMKLSSITLNSTAQFGNSPQTYEGTLNKIYYKVKSSTIILSSYRGLSDGIFGLKLDVSITTEPVTTVNVTLQRMLGSRFSIIGVSVIIVTAPFDTALKFYEFDMDIEYDWYDIAYTRPNTFQPYMYIKSMSQASPVNSYFDIWLQISTSSSTVLQLRFDGGNNYDSISVPDNYNVQAVVILLDVTTLRTIPQFNFLTRNPYYIADSVFSYTLFNINIAKYGRDINKKCVLGFPHFDDIRSLQPMFLFDLDALSGNINNSENSVNANGNFFSTCFHDLQCPPLYPFKKLNDFTRCWNCFSGVILSQQKVSFCNTYDNSVKGYNYDSVTGRILSYCLKCTECDNLYYAHNGDCLECKLLFDYCLTCDQKIQCLSCVVGYALDIAKTCRPCVSFLKSCQQCTDMTICTKCDVGYYLDSNNCNKCSQSMTYCKTCESATKCTQCNYPFTLSSDQTNCFCLKGKILTDTCSQVSGCISSHIISNTTKCYACDTKNNWMFQQPFNCTCKKGYAKASQTSCELLCGDGIWTQEQCDDGNLFNADGCSSKCNKEDLFDCTNVFEQRSICKFIPQISSSVFSLSRKFGSSHLTLKISFTPFHSIIMANNWPQNVIVNSSKIVFDYHQFQDNSILVLNYRIIQSVQNQTLLWRLNYDSDKFYTTHNQLEINMKGINAPLHFEAFYKHQTILQIVSYIVGGTAFLIAVVAMVKADSNIAFEIVTTVLFVFYARIMLHQDNPAILFTLSGLRVTEGFNEFFPDQHRDYKEYVIKNRFYIKSELELMSLFSLGLLSIILLLKVGFQVKSFFNLILSEKLSIKKSMDAQTKEWKQFKFVNKAYNAYLLLEKKCFTPVTIILLYRVFCTFNGFQDQNYRYQNHFSPFYSNIIRLVFFVVIIYYIAVGASIFSTLFAKMNAVDVGSKKLKKKVNLTDHQQTNPYADLFIVYLFATSVLIFFMIDFRTEQKNIDYAIEGCFGIILLYIVILIIYRPYEKVLNMVAIVLNEVTKMGFLVFLYFISKGVVSDVWNLVGTYLTLVLLLSLEAISIYRIKISWIVKKQKQNETDQLQNLKEVFKMNGKGNLVKQERLHNYKNCKGRKKLWINNKDNKYLYENIKKKEREDEIRKEEEAMNLYQALEKQNRGRKNNTFGKQQMGKSGLKLESMNQRWDQMGCLMEKGTLSNDKKDNRSELEKIKQRIRMSDAIRPREQLYRLK